MFEIHAEHRLPEQEGDEKYRDQYFHSARIRIPHFLIAFTAVLACAADTDAASRKVSAPPPALAKAAQLERIARGLVKPVDLDQPPGEKTRLYVVEQVGRIRLLEGGKVAETPVLDLTDTVSAAGSEQGLLGLEFHPKYAENRKLYVNYTDRGGETRVVEYTMDATGTRADPATARHLLKVDQPYTNHNGGHLTFGPDGKLWIGTGDGGSANDPHDNAQNPKALLGKMLVIDADAPDAKPEIRFLGLRNPWRYSFDRDTGDLYIADVGQNKWEWIHVVAKKDLAARLNLGWNVLEGSHCFKQGNCDKKKYRLPVVEYSHRTGCSITGGFVYRGAAIPALRGHYFYSDYCSALVRSFRWKAGAATEEYEWRPILDPKNKLAQISAFGQDGAGELYVVAHGGDVYKLVPRAP